MLSATPDKSACLLHLTEGCTIEMMKDVHMDHLSPLGYQTDSGRGAAEQGEVIWNRGIIMIMGDLFGIFCQRHLDLENASSPNKQTNKRINNNSS